MKKQVAIFLIALANRIYKSETILVCASCGLKEELHRIKEHMFVPTIEYPCEHNRDYNGIGWLPKKIKVIETERTPTTIIWDDGIESIE